MAKRNYLVEGLSGTGKSSVYDELIRRGYPAISTDRAWSYSADPDTGLPGGPGGHDTWMWDQHKAVTELQRPEPDVLFVCGSSRNRDRFLHYFTKIFNLRIDDDTMRRRLEARTDADWSLGQEGVELMLELNRTDEGPDEAIHIDATRPLDQVVDELLRLADALHVPPGEDPTLASYVEEAQADGDTLGVLLHGSRANGRARDGSDYDLIRIITQEAYDARRDGGRLHERVTLDDGSVGDVLYQTPSRIEAYVGVPDWFTATYLGAHVAFDRDGAVRAVLSRMRTEADRLAHEGTALAYDGYLNSFVRSIKSARHGDDLGRRLHAAESALALIRTLFGLESRWPPYHDNIAPVLPEIEKAQGWPYGYLPMALTRLVTDADPRFQQELEERVERLMTSRGVSHEWGDDLEPLKALRFSDDAGRDPALS